jgi:hypothetical protein
MTSFSDLKKNREKMFAELNKQVTQDSKGGRTTDDRIWYPSVDQAGNGFAIIRFLPAPDKETVPYIRMWSYGFKDRNGWYIENSRTTLGLNEKDPVYISNKDLRAEGSKASVAIADRRKASQSYFSNIVVVKDPAHPENEGKTFLFRYGAKIWGKIQAKMNPEFEGEEQMNPFDLWEGANFRMKIRTEKTKQNPKGFRNYDNSEWDQPGPLFDADAKMEKAWKAAYSLKDVIAPDKFKSYEELQAQFEKVTGEVANREERAPTRSSDAPSAGRSTPSWDKEDAEPEDPFAGRGNEQAASGKSEDEDDLEYYKKMLAAGDDDVPF